MEHNICKFNSAQSGDLTCARFVYETQNAQSAHARADSYILGVVVSGEGTLTAHTPLPLSAGQIFLIGKGMHFSVAGTGDFTYFYICFHGRRADELAQRFGFFERLAVYDLGERAATVIGFCFDCIHRACTDNLDLLSEAALLYVFSHLGMPTRPQNDLLTRMLMVTNDRFDGADFSLSVLAEMLGYDAKYLSALFKKQKGICYTAYLRDLRLKHALFLMEQGVVSVKNLALLSGFGDALYFSKIFKQATGKSPREYIENLQNVRTAATPRED